MKILIDNGHGNNTPGKRSPDQLLMEYAWTREVAARVVAELKGLGLDASLLTPELEDVPLKERVRRVNYWCSLLGARNVLVVSIHCNAAPGVSGEWHNASGWSVFVSEGKTGLVSAGSAALSSCLYDEAEKIGRKVRRQYYDKKYWVQSLAICRDTMCPAALTENYFMDNHGDCDWMLSEEGQDAVVRLHVEGIKKYVNHD